MKIYMTICIDKEVEKMIYKIKSKDIEVAVDSVGAQLSSVRDCDGIEYIWQKNPDVWAKSAPVLFPVVGRSRGGILEIEGKDYNMPIHGFIQGREMPLYKAEENKVTFLLEQNDEIRKIYPYDFKFYVVFEVEEKKLSVTYKVENKDSRDMYFGIGGHPGFSTQLKEGDKYEDYRIEFEYDEPLYSNSSCTEPDVEICSDEKYLVEKQGNILPLKRDLFVKDAMIFEDIKSKVIWLKSDKHNKGIKFSYADYPTIAIWSKGPGFPGATYVCFEPWQSMGYRTKEGRRIEDKFQIAKLEPNGVKEYTFEIEIL